MVQAHIGTKLHYDYIYIPNRNYITIYITKPAKFVELPELVAYQAFGQGQSIGRTSICMKIFVFSVSGWRLGPPIFAVWLTFCLWELEVCLQ